MTLRIREIWILIFLCVSCHVQAQTSDEFTRLKKAYPDCIEAVSTHYIAWKDGTRTPIRRFFPLADWFIGFLYHVDHSLGSISRENVRRDAYEPLFKKMYGHSAAEVKKKLVTIYWMPNIFGRRYPLRVTTVNDVDLKLQRISAELEKLPPEYYKYVENPGGSFYWRNVEGEGYLSAHSFGIAIDINLTYSNYWLWDLQKEKQPIKEYTYQNRNRIPLRIVQIFENEGFYWGGRWYFYDTMHFEYRPELFISA